METLILASASPRRRSMLEEAGFTVRVRPPDVDETEQEGESPEALVLRLARAKAAAIEAAPDEIVVAGDTVVALGTEILGKPCDAEEARTMLGAMSGRSHAVVGGWCVRRGDRVLSGVARTEIDMRALSTPEIDRYVESGDPLDKAGAYGIQSGGGAFIETVRGSYCNVVGLPLGAVLEAVRTLSSGS